MDITRIEMRYLFSVNSYLLMTGEGFVLIDTGMRQRRRQFDEQLARAGCTPGNLQLIVLTHAHADHAGNCAHVSSAFGAPIAMHVDDAEKARHGDMFWSSERRRVATRIASPLLAATGISRFEAFEPDVELRDGQHLGEYGLDAVVLHLPGHSPGSLGVLCRSGEFFCGDLLVNTRRPESNTLIDDASQYERSRARVDDLDIREVFPGHGRPFPADLLSGLRDTQQADRADGPGR